jgi:hypothetical protein
VLGFLPSPEVCRSSPGDLLPRGHPSNDDLVLQGLLPWQLRLWIWIPMLEISRPTSRWQFGFGLKMREKFLELPGEYFMFLYRRSLPYLYNKFVYYSIEVFTFI